MPGKGKKYHWKKNFTFGKKGARRKYGILTKSRRSLATMSYGGLNAFGRYDGKNPFPLNMYTKFTYTYSALFSAGTSGTVGSTTKIALNGLHDVDLTGVGHQCYGFDQLCSSSGPYYRYKVHGVLIDCEFYDPSLDVGVTGCAAVYNPVQYGAGSTISGMTIENLGERDNTWNKFISSTGKQSVHFRKYFPMYKLFQVSKLQFKSDINSSTGSNSGNPSSIPVLEVGILDVRQNACSAMIKITVTFMTQLYDRAQMGQS